MGTNAAAIKHEGLKLAIEKGYHIKEGNVISSLGRVLKPFSTTTSTKYFRVKKTIGLKKYKTYNVRVDHLIAYSKFKEEVFTNGILEKLSSKKAKYTKIKKERCINGHEYVKENTYTRPNGSIRCRICIRDASKNFRIRKKNKRKQNGLIKSR